MALAAIRGEQTLVGRVLSWRLSITVEAEFRIEAVEEAPARYGKPDIFNTDRGSQFTAVDVTADPPFVIGRCRANMFA